MPGHPEESRMTPDLPGGWSADGPYFKGPDKYLSKDGANPEAPWPGYGWPLGSECWYYVLTGHGYQLHVTGLTKESAARRAEEASGSEDPLRFTGAVRLPIFLDIMRAWMKMPSASCPPAGVPAPTSRGLPPSARWPTSWSRPSVIARYPVTPGNPGICTWSRSAGWLRP